MSVDSATGNGPVRWGFLSTARINQRVLAGSRRSTDFEVLAVASRSHEKAERYAEDHGIARSYGSYDQILDDGDVDAIYISLPNHLHVEWCEKSLAAGKHVLCEKPMTADPAEASALAALAIDRGVILSEAFMWRHNPQTRALERLLEERAVGDVVKVRTAIGFDLVEEWANRGAGGPGGRWEDDIRLQPAAGGGALMDVGTYCVNALRLVAGEPSAVRASEKVGPSGVDLRTSAHLEHEGGATGEFECFMDEPRREELEVIGSEGKIRVRTPFLCRQPGIEITKGGARTELEVEVADSYQLEFEDFSAAIRNGHDPRGGGEEAVRQAIALAAVRSAAADAPNPNGVNDEKQRSNK